VFWVLALGLFALVLGSAARMPEVVASHFDGGGTPNGWSTRSAYASLVLIIGIAVPLGVLGLVYAATWRGPEVLNIPSRAYWMSPANRAEAVRLVRAYMWWLGVLIAGTALLVHLAVLRANAATPPHLSGRAIVPLLFAVVLAIGAWAAGWYRVLRPPVEG
jgi:uncharacterized membrane protein